MSAARTSGVLASTALLVALIRAAPDSTTQSVERGIKAAARNDVATAEAAFKLAIRQDPGNARAHKLLGLLYATQQNYLAAEEPFRKACALAPNDEEAGYYLGHLYFNLNRFEESRIAFEQALNHGNHSSRLESGLALTLEVLGRLNDAEAHFKTAIRDGNKASLRLYGQYLFRHGRLEESLLPLRDAGDTTTLQRVNRAIEARPRVNSKIIAPEVNFASRYLAMIVRNGGTGHKHLIETMLAGIAVLDFDDDGWPDIFIANGATVPELKKVSPEYSNRLFRNNHDETFTDVTEKAGVAGKGYSMGVAAADFDNDGFTDLYVTGVHENVLYRNRGDGTFEDCTSSAGVAGDGTWSIAAGWLDYDNDGLLDLFVVRYVAWDPATEPYCGDPKNGLRSYCDPRLYRPLANVLYRNEGHGRFRDVSAESGIAGALGKGMGVAFGDYDGDGRLDMFVANDTVPNFLFHNIGNGRFEEAALPAGVAFNGDGKAVSSMGVDFRDYDNDGREDLFITALSNEGFTLFRNVGDSRFQETSQAAHISAESLPLSGWSTGFYDFNNDGYKDLFVANGHANDNAGVSSSLRPAQPNMVFLNRGGGSFSAVQLRGDSLHRGAAFGDFNRDGLIDIVVTGLNMPPQVLWNRTKSRNQWLDVKLRGLTANRDGIGAKIHLISANSSQWNRLTTSVGYGGSSEPTAHFGLTADDHIEQLEIYWPSGRRQILRGIRSNERLVVDEALYDGPATVDPKR